MKHLLPLCCLFAAFSMQAQTTACTSNYQLACDEEKRLLDEKKKIECRILEIQRDKQSLISCITAKQNKVELDKVKSVLIQTLNEVTRIQAQPVKLPTPCIGGNCNCN